MRRSVLIAVMVGAALVASMQAQAQGRGAKPPQISVNVDRQPLVQGEPFQLQISIETEGQGEPEIRLPRFGGLRILKQYESHPSSFHFSFGFGSQATNIRKEQSNYTYVLVADKPGKYKIDPVVVTMNGKKYRGDVYQLEVVKGTGASGGAAPLTPDLGQPDTPRSDQSELATQDEVIDLDGAKVDPDFFVQTAVSKKEAYVGELIVMTIYLYTSRQIGNPDILREPGTEGFWGENLVPSNQRRLESQTVSIGGRVYDRFVLRKMALFPIKPGELTIAPTIVEIETGRGGLFFSKRRAVKRASLPVTVTVSDLPAEGQPPSFNPANVGKFSFSAKIDNSKVKVGEPVTLTATVRGEGNIRNLVLPKINEIEGLKIYAPETESDVSPRGDTVIGTSASRTLMIPKKAGTYTLPEVEWTYFDPASKRYKTLSSKARQIVVTGRQHEETAAGQVETGARAVHKAGQDRLNRQLRSILSRAELSRGTGDTLTQPWYLVLFFGIPFIYAGFALASRTRRKLAESKLRNRSKHAEAEALKRLRELGKGETELSAEQFFAGLSHCIIGFIEDRLEVKAAGDTMSELRERLEDRGFSGDLAEKVVTEIETCDFARFAKGAGQADERRQATERAAQLIKELAGVKIKRVKKERAV